MIASEKVLSTQSLHLSGPEMSRLLGISLIEYYNLKHGSLQELKDAAGSPILYQLTISEENDPDILSKLKTWENGVANFSVEEVVAIKSL
jgi:hypothetical protein